MIKAPLIIFSLLVCFAGFSQETELPDLPKDSLRIGLKIQVIPKVLPKKASVSFTPKHNDHTFQPIFIQGKRAKTNFPIVPSKQGGSIEYFDVIAYSDEIEKKVIQIEVHVYKKDKTLVKREVEVILNSSNTLFFFGKKNRPLFSITLLELRRY